MSRVIPFPYEPYPQQRALMDSIYDCIESSSVGCFESPTGTGKSLSIICASLHWRAIEEARILREADQKCQSNASEATKPAIDDDWLMQFQREYSQNEDNNKNQKLLDNLQKMRNFQDRIARAARLGFRDANDSSVRSSAAAPFPTTTRAETAGAADPDDEFSLDFYDSDNDKSEKRKSIPHKKSATKSEFDGTGYEDDDDDDDCPEDDEDPIDALKIPQIIYCSRTHSQISQFVSEIKRTAFKESRCVSLASRRNLCIHPEVSKLGSDSKISERCLEMMKAKKGSGAAAITTAATAGSSSCSGGSCSNASGGGSACGGSGGSGVAQKRQRKKLTEVKPCEYHQKSREEFFADHALGSIRDIEELAVLGSKLKACPYYATRRALKSAHVICMPYNVLLHEDLRVSMGIKLEGRVLIFDEAHNVVEAVNHIHSANVTRDELVLAEQCVTEYAQRFQAVLTGRNYFYVSLLQSVLRSLRKCVDTYSNKVATAATAASAASTNTGVSSSGSTKSGAASSTSTGTSSTTALGPVSGTRPHNGGTTTTAASSSTAVVDSEYASNSEVLGTNEFIFRCSLDNINFFKLRRHVNETNLVNKIGGFADHQRAKREAEIQMEMQQQQVDAGGGGGGSVGDSYSVSMKREQNQKTASQKNISNTGKTKENIYPGNGADRKKEAGVDTLDTDKTAVQQQQQQQRLSCTQALRNALTLIFCLTGIDRDGRVVLTTAASTASRNTATEDGRTATATANSSSTAAAASTSSAVHGSSSTHRTAAAASASSSPPVATVPVPSIKFVLLNPSVHFQKIVSQARSVLLVGGTLQPFTYVKSFLFPTIPREKLRFFSCGHVIDPSHVTALVASQGPRGQRLEFTHETRMRKELITDLHAALLQTIRVVPNGVVVFFTSYQYMNFVISSWKTMGLFDQLLSFRPVYVEPSSAVEAERVLSAYSDSAQGIGARARGAVLFSVMGGKLSEGINFSDKLARCVVMVGMPFPDSRDPVLQEKLKFSDTLEANSGKKLYEAMCMKTVNQCIGRSIRHVNDYASIVLMDARYGQQRVVNLLPSWLASRVKACSSFSEVQSSLISFFADRKEAGDLRNAN